MRKIFSLLVTIMICVCLYSCNEKPTEPVPPPPPVVEPDTVSRYIWTVYHTGLQDISMVYAADTNHVYIVWGPNLLYWDGTLFLPYYFNDPNFYVTNVYGFGKNVIFVSGWKTKYGQDLPFVKKITNGIISDIQLDTVETYIYNQLIIGPDEAWFSSYLTNAVYHYKNGTVKKYNSYINDSLNTGTFYINTNKEIYLFQRQTNGIQLNQSNKNKIKKDLFERNSTGEGTFYSFKFENEKFNLLSSQCYSASDPNCFSILIAQCGNDALMFSHTDKISIFNGYNWVMHSRFDSVNTSGSRMGGFSKDSLVAFTINAGYLYTYGGMKWRIENNSPLIYPPSVGHSNLEAKFGNIYFCYWSQLSGERGLFYVGKPNKNFKGN